MSDLKNTVKDVGLQLLREELPEHLLGAFDALVKAYAHAAQRRIELYSTERAVNDSELPVEVLVEARQNLAVAALLCQQEWELQLKSFSLDLLPYVARIVGALIQYVL